MDPVCLLKKVTHLPSVKINGTGVFLGFGVTLILDCSFPFPKIQMAVLIVW
jgi:hypothetical protein